MYNYISKKGIKMKINIGPKVANKKLNNVFVFEINTMEGDADDYHSFNLNVEKEKDVKKLIIYCNVLEKSYPNGKGGDDEIEAGTGDDTIIFDSEDSSSSVGFNFVTV